jgi:hypothetical protein
MSTLSCLALGTSLLPQPMLLSASPPETTCLQVGAEVAGRYARTRPAGGIDEAFHLSRSRFELGLEQQGAGARVVMAGVRSGGDTAYVGIAGESIVPRLQVAEARYRARRLGLSIAGGLVDDPWVVTGNQAWDLRAVAPGLGEDQGWLDRSDLGLSLAWTSPGAWTTLAVVSHSGEGLARRERNNGQNTTGLVVVRPLAGLGRGGRELLTVQLMGREGSRGLGRARDHRLGARLTHRSDWVAGSAELLRAWGVQGDALREPLGWSTAAQLTPPPAPVVAFARYDNVDEDLEFNETSRRLLHAGAGLELPPDHAQVPPLRLLLGWTRASSDRAVASLAGAAALETAHTLWVQLDFRGRASLDDLRPLPVQ